MTQSHKAIILSASMFYREPISDEALLMYAEELSDIDPGLLLEALKDLRKDPKITRLPLPAVIRSRATPSLNEQDRARIIAARIITGVSKIGPYEISRTKEFLGPMGWAVVEAMGGWQFICTSITNENLTSYQAQLRDLASAFVNGKRSLHSLDHETTSDKIGEFVKKALSFSNGEEGRLAHRLAET